MQKKKNRRSFVFDVVIRSSTRKEARTKGAPSRNNAVAICTRTTRDYFGELTRTSTGRKTHTIEQVGRTGNIRLGSKTATFPEISHDGKNLKQRDSHIGY